MQNEDTNPALTDKPHILMQTQNVGCVNAVTSSKNENPVLIQLKYYFDETQNVDVDQDNAKFKQISQTKLDEDLNL